MKVARGVALLSYRHPETYNLYQEDADINALGPYRSESYQAYQGEKLANRFNAFSYYRLSQSMDSHHVGRRPRECFAGPEKNQGKNTCDQSAIRSFVSRKRNRFFLQKIFRAPLSFDPFCLWT